ncbi:MAG: prepilin-type N-terminal cleavage/methylation domain-containing protein [Candidatus Omnitrophica bacterium]|nr:prepilin-type N-terminal cleavage/methylation domain-containing protein [Candidatus Omnitrophota bacterium]
MQKRKIDIKGFTLVEILIAIGILAMLSAIILPNYFRAKQEAIEKTCLANVKQLESGLELAAMIDNANVANLTESEIEALIVPSYVKRMPDCLSGDYYSDANSEVHCSSHGP